MVRAANLAVKFLLELVGLGALGYWGATAGRGALAALLAITAPAAAIVVWGLFAAPRARRRLPVARVPLELGVFGLAAASLAAAGSPGVAVAFGVLVIANCGLLTAGDLDSYSLWPGKAGSRCPAPGGRARLPGRRAALPGDVRVWRRVAAVPA